MNPITRLRAWMGVYKRTDRYDSRPSHNWEFRPGHCPRYLPEPLRSEVRRIEAETMGKERR